MTTTLVALVGTLAACGGDDSDSTPTAATPGDTSPASGTAPASDEAVEPAADGTPSAWYSELDDVAVPAAGTGTLVIGGETIDLTVSCDIAVDNVVFGGIPEQGDEGFVLTLSGSGLSVDGRNVGIFGSRMVNPDHLRPDPYEVDLVQINVRSDDERAASALEIRRAEAGGPVGNDHQLPLLKIQPDGPTLTAIGETTHMVVAGDADPAIIGPFEFAAHCG